MNFLIKLLYLLIPNKVLGRILKEKYLKKHKYPPSTLVHRKQGKVIFEIEVNWYDENLDPVSLVREVKSGKQYSISYEDMIDFKEYSGTDITLGNTI